MVTVFGRAGLDESSQEARLCLFLFLGFCNLLINRIWASDFVFKADNFAREYGDVNPGIPFRPEGGDTANLSASLRLPFQFVSGEEGCSLQVSLKAMKADHFAREYGDVNPGIPFWPEGGDTANLSASLRLPFQFAVEVSCLRKL